MIAIVLPCVLMLPVPPAAAQGVVYEGGVSLSAGKYGYTETLTQAALTSGIALYGGRWTARASVPVYVQGDSWIVPTGGGRVARGPGQVDPAGTDRGRMGSADAAAASDLAGLGDLVIRVSWAVPTVHPNAATAGVAVKAPIAGDDFGTGAWDAGVSLDVGRTTGSYFIGAGVAWWYVGDVPGLDLRSPLSGSILIGRSGPVGGSVSLSLFAATPAQQGIDPAATIGLSYGRPFGPVRTHLGIYFGLTDAVPGFSTALSWRVPLRTARPS